MASAERTETFNVDCESYFKVLTHYESYAEFMDGVSSVEVLERNENKVKVKYEINIIKSFSYTLLLTEESPHKLSWEFVEGDLFSSNSGSWELKDVNGQCEVTYKVDVDFKIKVPGMVTKKLVSGNLPSLMKAVYKRAQ